MEEVKKKDILLNLADLDDTARVCRALSSETRLEILKCLIDRAMTISELAEQLGVEPAEASQALGASQQPLSLSADEENGGGQIDVPTEAPEEKISELIALKQVVGELDPRDRSLIVMRFFKSRTQTQTAEMLGMTQVQVSRREKKILQELKAKLS